MSDGNPFTEHHDFFGTQPPALPQPEADPKATQRAENRALISKTFSTPEGKVVLVLLEKLAVHLPDHPINTPDAAKATQLLWYQNSRKTLIDEIKAIVEQENSK